MEFGERRNAKKMGRPEMERDEGKEKGTPGLAKTTIPCFLIKLPLRLGRVKEKNQVERRRNKGIQ